MCKDVHYLPTINILNETATSDVTLALDDESFQAHKVILVTSSVIFSNTGVHISLQTLQSVCEAASSC